MLFFFDACCKRGRQLYTTTAPSCCIPAPYCHLSATLQTISITVVNLQDNRAVFRVFIALLRFSFDSPSYFVFCCADRLKRPLHFHSCCSTFLPWISIVQYFDVLTVNDFIYCPNQQMNNMYINIVLYTVSTPTWLSAYAASSGSLKIVLR